MQGEMRATLQEALLRSAHMKLGSCLTELSSHGPSAFNAWRRAAATMGATDDAAMAPQGAWPSSRSSPSYRRRTAGGCARRNLAAR